MVQGYHTLKRLVLMSVEHFALLMRFRNGEPMNRAEIDRLCQFENDPWPLELWLEEQEFIEVAA